MLLWFGVLALKTGFPPRRDVGYDWALDRAHLWRNGVEHLERSAELRGRAVVDNENEEGETKSKSLGRMEQSAMQAETLLKQTARERKKPRNCGKLDQRKRPALD